MGVGAMSWRNIFPLQVWVCVCVHVATHFSLLWFSAILVCCGFVLHHGAWCVSQHLTSSQPTPGYSCITESQFSCCITTELQIHRQLQDRTGLSVQLLALILGLDLWNMRCSVEPESHLAARCNSLHKYITMRDTTAGAMDEIHCLSNPL